MDDNGAVVKVLEDSEARELLQQATFGRLIERIGDITEVFPVNFWSDGHRLIFRTAPGTKLAGIIVADEVIFQTDFVSDDIAWSVVARGTARILETAAERKEAAKLKLKPLIPTVKEVFVEFQAVTISGRYFHIGPEPEAAPETIA